ncbi:MAG: c-type cytochrome [Steroidobacteraceae bacterium]|jgi:cytochrome c
MSRTADISLSSKVMAALAVALAASVVSAQPAAPADQSAEFKRGRMLYIQCRACHDLQPSPVEKVGPNLGGVIGRRAGSAADFAYSPALQASKLVWDEATLDRWLEKPSALAPGNTMAFAGIANAADRAALIRYIVLESAPR